MSNVLHLLLLHWQHYVANIFVQSACAQFAALNVVCLDLLLPQTLFLDYAKHNMVFMFTLRPPTSFGTYEWYRRRGLIFIAYLHAYISAYNTIKIYIFMYIYYVCCIVKLWYLLKKAEIVYFISSKPPHIFKHLFVTHFLAKNPSFCFLPYISLVTIAKGGAEPLRQFYT